jgi:hypothetical protein
MFQLARMASENFLFLDHSFLGFMETSFFCHRLSSAIFPFRRRPPLTLLSSLSGWSEQAGDALPTMTDAEKASVGVRHPRHGVGYQASTPDMVSGIRISR